MKNLLENWRRFVVKENDDLNWSAKCLIFDDAGRILLVEVANKGTLDLPGGHGRKGETPIEAMKREVSEEIGLEVSEIIKLGPINSEKVRYIFVALNFAGDFELQLSEVSNYYWADFSELLIDIEGQPQKFEDTVILAMDQYTEQIREISSIENKIEYYKSHPRYNPEDYMARPMVENLEKV
jgi:8-oxo-dGTP pyrophosphatase MutT (NUDIX family)